MCERWLKQGAWLDLDDIGHVNSQFLSRVRKLSVESVNANEQVKYKEQIG